LEGKKKLKEKGKDKAREYEREKGRMALLEHNVVRLILDCFFPLVYPSYPDATVLWNFRKRMSAKSFSSQYSAFSSSSSSSVSSSFTTAAFSSFSPCMP
jgi:hypothetical protein